MEGILDIVVEALILGFLRVSSATSMHFFFLFKAFG